MNFSVNNAEFANDASVSALVTGEPFGWNGNYVMNDMVTTGQVRNRPVITFTNTTGATRTIDVAIFIGGSIGPYLGISLTHYYPTNFAEQVVAGIAFLVHSLLNRFGEIQPAQMLVEGRVIPWSEVWLEFFWLVVVWAFISLLVGFTAFSRKELAIYSGQG